MPDEKLLTTREVMERLDISRPTVYALIERGKIAPVENSKPYLKKRVRLLFRETDVERLRRGEE